MPVWLLKAIKLALYQGLPKLSVERPKFAIMSRVTVSFINSEEARHLLPFFNYLFPAKKKGRRKGTRGGGGVLKPSRQVGIEGPRVFLFFVIMGCTQTGDYPPEISQIWL